MSSVAKRVFGLDLLRCVAIILVLITHTITLLNPQIFYKTAVYTGYLGVEFFFVLSGFLIGSILLKEHYHAAPIGFKNIRIFWIRRWFRTLPNYYLMFIVYALLIYFSRHVNVLTHVKYLSYLVFLQNSVTYQPNDFYQIAWSLSIEEWFYLLFPLLLLLFTRVFKKNISLPFLMTILMFIVIELVIRIYVALFLHHTWDEGFRKLMPLRLDSIGIGVLAAYIKFNQSAFWKNNVKNMALTGVVLLVALTIYIFVDYVARFDPVTWDHAFNAGVFLETLFFTLTSFSIALMIPYLCSIKINRGIFSRTVTFISEISYSIYLSHLFIILALARVFKSYENVKYSNTVLFISSWIAIILISAVQYNFFEVKMTALRNKFSKEQDIIKI